MTQTTILRGASQRAHAKHLIDRAPADAVVRISEPTRTTDQNAKLHAMLSEISVAKPDGRKHTPEVWKALFMHACSHAVQFEIGLNGQPFPVGFRSSRLTVRQMSDLIYFIECWCAEKGIELSEGRREAA